MSSEERDLSSGAVVFCLLLDKSAIGIYTTEEKADEARKTFEAQYAPANRSFAIKPFTLDGPAMIYRPY